MSPAWRWAWGVLALLAAAWAAGDLILGILVAPAIFARAAELGIGRDLAGGIFGGVLLRWTAFAALLALPCAGILGASAGRDLKLRRLLPAVAAAVLAAALVLVHARVQQIALEGETIARELRQQPDEARAELFRGEFHRAARVWYGLEALLALTAAGAAVAVLVRTPNRPSRTPPRA
jgi:hypothetical protein